MGWGGKDDLLCFSGRADLEFAGSHLRSILWKASNTFCFWWRLSYWGFHIGQGFDHRGICMPRCFRECQISGFFNLFSCEAPRDVFTHLAVSWSLFRGFVTVRILITCVEGPTCCSCLISYVLQESLAIQFCKSDLPSWMLFSIAVSEASTSIAL